MCVTLPLTFGDQGKPVIDLFSSREGWLRGTSVPHKNIYAIDENGRDLARWLRVTVAADGQILLRLQDLCHPGRVSRLSQVTCPASFVRLALDGSPVQITTGTGYLLLRRAEDELALEFRSLDDVSTTRVSVSAAEVCEQFETLVAATPELQTT